MTRCSRISSRISVCVEPGAALWRGSGLRAVRRVASMNRDGHRTGTRIGEQAVVHLQHAMLAVAVVTALCQWTGLALEVARRQVMQHGAARLQMASGEFFLDRILALEQSIHRRVQFILVGIGHAKLFRQSRRMPSEQIMPLSRLGDKKQFLGHIDDLALRIAGLMENDDMEPLDPALIMRVGHRCV